MAPDASSCARWRGASWSERAGTVARHHDAVRDSIAVELPLERWGRRRSTSAEYAADFMEVKRVGEATSATRTADQTESARFWAGTAIDSGIAPRSTARRRASQHTVGKRPAVRAAELVAMADAAHLVLGCQVSLQVLAADHGHPSGQHRRQRRDRCPSDVDTADHDAAVSRLRLGPSEHQWLGTSHSDGRLW